VTAYHHHSKTFNKEVQDQGEKKWRFIYTIKEKFDFYCKDTLKTHHFLSSSSRADILYRISHWKVKKCWGKQGNVRVT
jgi:hypothetical protein